MGVAAAISAIAALGSATTAGVGLVKANEARNEAKATAEEQRKKQEQAINAEKAEREKQDQQKMAVIQRDAMRRMNRANREGAGRGSILTSPLGGGAGTTTGGKTLLGL